MNLSGETHFITITIGGKTYSGLLREVEEEAAAVTATPELIKYYQNKLSEIPSKFASENQTNPETTQVITGEYLDRKKLEYLGKEKMTSIFVRKYHLVDGRTIELGADLTREEAEECLWFFHPSEYQDADDMQLVDYVTIEQHFQPAPQ